MPYDNSEKSSDNKKYIVVYSEDRVIMLVPSIKDPLSEWEEA